MEPGYGTAVAVGERVVVRLAALLARGEAAAAAADAEAREEEQKPARVVRGPVKKPQNTQQE